MANLKEVKNRINSVASTQQITKAMKMVDAAKLRKAQERITNMRPYSQKLAALLRNVSGASAGEVDNPYAEVRKEERVLIVVVTSDKGLCGAFNSTVTRKVASLLENEYKTQFAAGNVQFLPIGKKGLDYLKRRDFQYIDGYSHLFHDLDFDHVRNAAEFVMNSFLEGAFDKVEIVYNEFKNVATQILQVEQFLPIAHHEEEAKEETKQEKKGGLNNDYIYEPSKAYIEKELIPKSLKIQFYKALLESKAAEHGARMTAMDKATDNAGELLKDLRLTYNRTRQAAITTEILEITAGAEALAKE